MSGMIEKKGKILGTGKPLICVPVTEQREEDIVEEIKLLANKQVDMIEWRADWFEKVTESDRVTAILEKIRPYIEETFSIRKKVVNNFERLEFFTINIRIRWQFPKRQQYRSSCQS